MSSTPLSDDPNHEPPRDGASRLAAHLALLGISDQKVSEALRQRAQREQKLLDAVGDLPPLAFENDDVATPLQARPSRSWLRPGGVVFALAAAVALLLWVQREDELPGWRTKGGRVPIQIYFERSGTVAKFVEGSKLQNGDRIRIEVAADRDLVAFLAITNRAGSIISDLNEATTQPLRLRAGEQQMFTGSLELVGLPEGETVAVLLCPLRVILPHAADELSKQLRQAFSGQFETTAFASCQLQTVRLR